MQRAEFLRLCVLTGLAGASGIARGAEDLPSGLPDALRQIGVTNWSVARDGEMLRIRGQVGNFDALAQKAGALGDGKIQASRNTLSFNRMGQAIQLELIA